MFTPKRLDRALAQRSDTGRHASFLDQVRAADPELHEVRRRAALGAYLAARLVDRLLSADEGADGEEGLRWQRESTLYYMRDLPDDDVETRHLAQVVASIEPAARARLGPVRIALQDYASFLEHEGRLAEALEVLRLLATTWSGDVPAGDFGSLALFAARLNRQLGRWELAAEAYLVAEEAAAESGDIAVVLRARLGRASVLRARGDFGASRLEVERVIDAAAGEPHLAAVLGAAYGDLGAVLARAGQPVDGVRALYEAYRRTPDPIQRLRILGELGAGLAELGASDSARIAFELVAASPIGVLVRAGACLELMDLASAGGDRLGFERHRAAARGFADRMPPGVAVDFGFRTALGLARFGQFGRAEETWNESLVLARATGLVEWARTIEHVLERLDGCSAGAAAPAEAVEPSPEVAELAADLRTLAARAGG